MSDNITLPSLYNVNSPPSKELIEQIQKSDASEFLGLSVETVEQIASVLNFYKNMRERNREWKEAQLTSSKALKAAGEKALEMVSVIRDDILRMDNASMYHQDAIEGYAFHMKERHGVYPGSGSDERQGGLYGEGVNSLRDIEVALNILAIECERHSKTPSYGLPEFSLTAPPSEKYLKRFIVPKLNWLLDPYSKETRVDDIREMLSIAGHELTIKSVRNITSQG